VLGACGILGVVRVGRRSTKGVGLVDYVYREIVFQSYAASRLTGLPIAQANRIIRSALRSKYVVTGVYGFIFVLIMFATVTMSADGRLIFPLEAFIWVFLLVFLPTLQISYGASAGGQIREILGTLPITGSQIERLAARAILKTIDIPLAVAFGVLVVGGAFVSPLFALSSVLGGICSLSVAMIAILVLMRTFRRFNTSSRFGSLLRMIVVVPAIFVWVLTGYVANLKVAATAPTMVYAPILNLIGIAAGVRPAIYLGLLYTLVLGVVGYKCFLSASTLLLSPMAAAPQRVGRFKIKVRSQLTSILVTDLRQVVRSPRLIGFFVTPLVFVTILVYDLYFGAVGRIGFNFVYIQDIVPFVFAISYMPYVLYLSELRGYSYFKILPIRNSMNVLSKMATTLLVFFTLGSVMAYAAYIPTRQAYVFLAVYSLALPLTASVLLTTVYFHYSLRKMTMGVAGTLASILFTVVNIVVLGVPVSSYYTGVLLGASPLASVSYLCVVSLIEIIVLMLIARSFKP
jgi:predicted permease